MHRLRAPFSIMTGILNRRSRFLFAAALALAVAGGVLKNQELFDAEVARAERRKPTRVVSVFIGGAAYLIGAQASSGAAFNQHQSVINASLGSFHAITAEERAAARPHRLRVITASDGFTFAELARRSPLGRHAEGYLRVITGLYPAGEPAAGQALKIVE
jgi:predicted Zn-dependent protease